MPKTIAAKPAKKKSGLAAVSPAERTRICRLGGLAVSKDRKRMKRIGTLGGKNSHKKTNGK